MRIFEIRVLFKLEILFGIELRILEVCKLVKSSKSSSKNHESKKLIYHINMVLFSSEFLIFFL